MRLILTFIMLLSMESCKTIPSHETVIPSKNFSNECPDDGDCDLKVMKNSMIALKKDDFGSLYPEVGEGAAIVLKFEYQRRELANTEDSSYREVIYLQLNPESPEVDLQSQNLKNASLVFGRFCFCRGQSGWFRISSGNLKITKIQTNTYRIQLEFLMDEVPQIIQSINQVFEI